MIKSLRGHLIFFQILLIVIFAMMMTYSMFEIHRITAKSTKEEALRVARQVKWQQLRWIDETKILLPLIAKRLSLTNGNSTDVAVKNCSAYLVELQEDFPQYLNFGVINPDGSIQCSALPFKKGARLDDRDYFISAKKSRTVSMGNYQIGRITGKASINFGFPLYDNKGEFNGVIFAAINIEAIDINLTQLSLPEGSVVTLLSSAGTILTRYPHGEDWVGRTAIEWPVVQLILRSKKEGTAKHNDYRGVERLYSFTPFKINSRSIYVLVGIPSQLAYADANALYLRNLIVLLTIASLFILFSWFWFGQSVLKPLESLRLTSEKLNQGDFSARTNLLPNNREINQLGCAFNKMAGNIEARYQEKLQNEKILQDVNRALRTLSGGNHALIRANEELELLQDMCRVAVEEGGYIIF
ncbi:cache domain-containing protein [Porticoccus sp.]